MPATPEAGWTAYTPLSSGPYIPGNGIDAVQLEISQRNYMDETSFDWDEGKAARLQRVLRALLEAAL